MAISFQRSPLRAATYRALQIGVWSVGTLAGVITAIAAASWGGLILAPLLWFSLFYGLQVYYPEPALDEWDSLPKATRIALLDAFHPGAMKLAEHDKDPEVRRHLRAMFRK